MFKKVFLSGLIFSVIFLAAPVSQGREPKTYSKGEAVNYKGNIIIASANYSNIDLFQFKADKLQKTFEINPLKKDFSNSFSDAALNQEEDKLYLYAVNGRYLYKYDISDPYSPIFIAYVSDENLDWFSGLARQGDNIVTIGNKGLKIWNHNLEVINRYPEITNKLADNISFSQDGKWIFNLNNKLEIISAYSREQKAALDFAASEFGSYQFYYDAPANYLYLVDDQKLRRFNISNFNEDKSFQHISKNGYDAAGFDKNNYIYFSDGYGIVKNAKETLRPLDWEYAWKFGPEGSWAQHFSLVSYQGGERLVVFNTNNIAILNENLELIDYVLADKGEQDGAKDLFLKVNKTHAPAGALVYLTGGGYAPNEELEIYFANKQFLAKVNRYGEISQGLIIPNVSPKLSDIQVKGKISKLSYSIGLEID